jgi:nitroreductase
MFLQTLMLAARARGLHTCPEAAIASYPDVVRRELGITADWIVICGMALGYADPGALINTYQPPRIGVDDYTVFLD